MAFGINASNTIVGITYDKASNAHGFTRSKSGRVKTFDVSGATDTVPLGINAAGAIAGIYLDSKGLAYGFLKEP